MTKMADECFAITGLTSSYAFLLMTVNEDPGIQPKQISALMQLTPSTVTRLIEKMEHRGLLTRKSVGRSTEVYPTQASHDLNDKIKEAWTHLRDKYNTILGKKEGDELAKLIHGAIQKLE